VRAGAGLVFCQPSSRCGTTVPMYAHGEAIDVIQRCVESCPAIRFSGSAHDRQFLNPGIYESCEPSHPPATELKRLRLFVRSRDKGLSITPFCDRALATMLDHFVETKAVENRR